MQRKSILFAIFFLLLVSARVTHAGSLYMNTSNTDEIAISTDEMSGDHVVEIQSQVTESALDVSITPPLNAVNAKEMRALPFQQEVLEAANSTALAPALIHAVIAVESRHNPQAVSRKGAYGLMQLMPATAQRYGLKALKQANHRQHILAGAQYLKELIQMFDGDLELALAAYNAGPAAVKKYQHRIPPFRETKLYVPKVLKLYRSYSG